MKDSTKKTLKRIVDILLSDQKLAALKGTVVSLI